MSCFSGAVSLFSSTDADLTGCNFIFTAKHTRPIAIFSFNSQQESK